MRRALENLAMACLAAAAFAFVGFLIGYPIAKCGFWTAALLGKGAFWAAYMGLCG